MRIKLKIALMILLAFPSLVLASKGLETDRESKLLAMYVYGKANLNGIIEKAVFLEAVSAYSNAKKSKKILTFIDYTMPSYKKRLFVFDMKKGELIYNTYVAHGKGSGMGAIPVQFSNNTSSWQTSLGTFVTEGTYYGKNGYSLVLNGLSGKLNNKAKSRYIVFHGSKYSEKSFIDKNGILGTSHGCPSVPKSISKEIINTIKNGSIIYSHGIDVDKYNLPVINMPKKIKKLALLFAKN